MRLSPESVGYLFDQDSAFMESADAGIVENALSSVDNSEASLLISNIMKDSPRASFVKQYPLATAKAMVLPASSCTLGHLLLKASGLAHNKKGAHPLEGITKENFKEKIDSLDVFSTFLWNSFGNSKSISALYKLNMLNWHWANGNSAFWKFGGKLKEHNDAITLLFDMKQAGNTKGMYTFYKSYAKHLLQDAGFQSPSEIQQLGIAAAFYAETQGDVSLFNSMTNQNLDFIRATTDYAYGIQQRLNSRLIGYHIWLCKKLVKDGFDIFTVPAAVMASPIFSRYYEAEYMKSDDHMKSMIASYMRVTKGANLTSIVLSGGKRWSGSGYTSGAYATGAALHYIQGIVPSSSAANGYGSNWNAKAKFAKFNSLNSK